MSQENHVGPNRGPARRAAWLCVAVAVVVGLVLAGRQRTASSTRTPIDHPALLLPTPNGFQDLVEAGRMIREPYCMRTQGWYGPLDVEPTSADRAILANDIAAFDRMHAGLARPVQMYYNSAFSWVLDSHDLNRLERSLRCKAVVEESEGHSAEAESTCLDAIGMAFRLEINAPFVVKMSCIRMNIIGRASAWAPIPHLKAADARNAARRLWAMDATRPAVADSIGWQDYCQVQRLQDTMDQNNWRELVLNDIAIESGRTEPELLSMGKTQIIQYVDRSWKGVATIAERPLATPLVEPPHYVGLPLATLDGGRIRDAVDAAQTRMLATALALQAYRQEHHAYPPSLTALAPAYLPGVPQDPFRNGPLRYRPDDQGYHLYSVGPDGRDDGGTPIYDPIARKTTGDIVAGVEPLG